VTVKVESKTGFDELDGRTIMTVVATRTTLLSLSLWLGMVNGVLISLERSDPSVGYVQCTATVGPTTMAMHYSDRYMGVVMLNDDLY
jgi:hypothetical protein